MGPPALLTTKLSAPQLRLDVIARPELMAALDHAQTVALVSAAPGYGKTTLIGAWLRASGCTAAWLTLDEADNDPAVFVAYLLAAIRRALPELEPVLSPTAASPQLSTQTLTPLLNALAESERPLVLVLDDYHQIRDRAVHELVGFLVTHLPAGVRLVLGTREDPPLPLSRLRVRGQLVEIRAADLRLSAAAAAEFLRTSMRLDVSDDAVERLTNRTEGWVAGLQLAGLSLRAAPDPRAFVEAFDASDRYLVDYLADEALARQPEEVRSFLAETSVLDRLTGPLCDALTGRSDGAQTLVALERANLFLTALDERREWFRYHPLFADLLRSELSTARRTELNRRAAAWFAEHDLPVDAIRHALAGGEADAAAAQMDAIADVTLARGEMRTIEAWCDALPPPVVARYPRMRVARAWARFFLGDLETARSEAAALRSSDGASSPSPRLTVLEAWLANRRDDAQAALLARRAIDEIGTEDPIFRSLAFTTLGEALHGGDVREATAAYEQAFELARVAPNSTLALGTVYSLALAYLIRGRRRDAETLCRRAIADAVDRSGGSPFAVGMVHLPLGTAMYEADELEMARPHFALGNELCDRAGFGITMLGAAEWYEVLTLHGLGEVDAAWRRLEAVRRDARRHGIVRLAMAMESVAAEMLLIEGDAVAAERRLDAAGAVTPNLLGSTAERFASTRARVLLALGRASEGVAALEQHARRQRELARGGRLVETLTLLAASRQQMGDREPAVAALGEAVELAAGEDRRREFVTTPAIEPLLAEVRPMAPAFVDDVLSRRRSPAGVVAGRGTVEGSGGEPAEAGSTGLGAPVSTSSGGRSRQAPTPFAEPLTLRELQVLRLVTAGLSNDEIGRELFVTPGTAKWHVHNLLGKLGARDRVGLVARSRQLGLL